MCASLLPFAIAPHHFVGFLCAMILLSDLAWEHWPIHFFPSILRWDWVFVERTRILRGIQFTTHFIEIFVVETKRFVGSFANVILTWQTCGQRSSRAAESKHSALGNYFSERICCMFLISKCRGSWDLGLCAKSGLAFGEPRRSGDFREKNVFRRRKNWILPLRCCSPNASPNSQ